MMTLSKEFRLAQYYLDRLRFIHDVYREGGDHVTDALRLLEKEWGQIKGWYLWAWKRVPQDQAAALLCGQFIHASGVLLDFMLPLREHLDWQTFALSLARVQADRPAQIFHLLALAQIHEKLDLYVPAIEYAQEAVTLALDLYDHASIGQGTRILGILYKHLGKYSSAANSFWRGLHSYQLLQDIEGIAQNLFELGDVASLQGDYQEAAHFHQQSLTFFQRTGNRRGIAHSMQALAAVLYFQGEYDTAQTHNAQALSILQQIGDRWGAAEVMLGLGVRIFGQEGVATAHQYAEQSLALNREIGSLRGIAHSLLNLGLLEAILTHYEPAQNYCQESLELYQQIHHRLGIAHSSTFLAYAYLGLEEKDCASVYLAQALELALEIEAKWLVPMILGGVSYFYFLRGEVETSAAIYGLAEASPCIRADLKQYGLPVLLNNELRFKLEPAALTAALDKGRTLDLESTLISLVQQLKSYSCTVAV